MSHEGSGIAGLEARVGCEGAGAPEELDEALLEVMAHRDDVVDRVGPDDEHTLVALLSDGTGQHAHANAETDAGNE